MKKLLLLLFIPFCSIVNAQWTSQATGFTTPSRGLNEIKIVDANIVWAKAYDGNAPTAVIQEFTRTVNGGANWTPGTINVGDPAIGINNICPISATTAWVSAVHPVTGAGSVVYKTSNAGVNWDQQLPLGFTSTGSFVNFVHFFDANIGFAMGDPVGAPLEFEIWRTVNGGDNWTQVPGANIPNPSAADEYGINGGNVVLGNTVWLVTTKGRILKSTDLGITWSVTQAPLTHFGSAAQSGQLDFSDANNGCLLKTVGTTYTYYTTTTGGASWSAGTPFTGSRRILTYVPGTATIVATGVGALAGTSVSVDNGATWTSVESADQRGETAILNLTTGWTAGLSTNATTGGVFKLTGPLANTSFEPTSNFTLYPNPVNNTITISVIDIESYQLSVTDLTGKTVLTKSLNGIENTLDVSSLSSGAYFFTLNSGDKKETVKIIKN